jgi:Predicted glycosyltransferases
MDIDLSIVVVSYNTREMTRECLASVFANAGSLALQVIVVDNDSRDGSVEMIRAEFPQVELIANDQNRGFAAANNQGFRLARGEFVLLLNSDTVVLGDVLSASVRYMREHPRAGAFGCRVLNTDRTTQPTCSGYPTLGRLALQASGLDRLMPRLLDRYLLRHWQRDSEREVEVISGCYLMVRRQVIEQVGGLDEQFFFFGEETDWCRRIARAGWQLRFAPVGEIIHHGGGSVRKLNYRRDVMLTAALVRLHRKNGGRLAALAAFLILFGFNLSRMLWWSGWALAAASARERAAHFRQVVGSSLATWPRG